MRLRRSFSLPAFLVAGAIWGAAAAAQDDTGTTGQSDDTGAADGVIHLHMPVHHPVHRAASAPAPEATAPASVDSIGAEPAAPLAPAATEPEPAPVPIPAPTRTSAPASGPAATKTASHATAIKAAPAIPFSFGEDSGEAAPPPPPPEAPVQTASIPRGLASSRASDEHAGLTKRGAVMFAKGDSDPSPAQFQGVRMLAGDLANALESGGTRVELDAYGGAPGDKSSDARRLSLKRALAVRQLLIDNGVPSSRIDVRAMGGIDDRGAPDRVDVFVRT